MQLLLRKTSDDPERIGPFDIVARIGGGGFGLVYLGLGEDGAPAAVKVLITPESGRAAPDRDGEPLRTKVKRFQREIEFLQEFRHPLVPELIKNSGRRTRRPWLATRYVPGPPLEKVVEQFGPLPPQAVLWLAFLLSEILVDLHKVGAYRDLHPYNVLITATTPQLIDFGTAHQHGEPPVTETGVVIARKNFRAPEQLKPDYDKLEDTSVDVFQLGLTLVYAATGRILRRHGETSAPPSPDKVVDLRGLHPDLTQVVKACLYEDERLRPSAAEIRTIAQAALQAESFRSALPMVVTAALERSAADLAAAWNGHRVRAPMARPTTQPVGGPRWEKKIGDWVQSVTPVPPARILLVTLDGSVYLLAEEDGRVLWRGNLSDRPRGPVVVVGDRAYLGTRKGILHTLELQTGQWAPRVPLRRPISACVPHGSTLIVAAGETVQRLSPTSGRLLWEQPVGRTVADGMVVHRGILRVGTVDGLVHALTIDDGHIADAAWRVGEQVLAMAGSETGVCVTGAEGGMLVLRSGETPPRLVRYQREPVPACDIHGGVLVTGSVLGTVSGEDLTTGAVLFQHSSTSSVRRSLTLDANLVVVGRADGSLDVLKMPSGEQILRRPARDSTLEAPAAVTSAGAVVAGWADGSVALFEPLR